MSGHAAVEKRISRSKKVLASSQRLFDIADTDMTARLPAVHRALYLLFNEGYHGASSETSMRTELCQEAMRLAALLIEHPRTATPTTFALAALLYLHAARLPGRVDDAGNLSPLAEQDRSRWDTKCVEEGLRLLDHSAIGLELTQYHVEAGIAALHAGAQSAEATDWAGVVWLYDTLVIIRPSPVVALNRAIAVGQLEGAERGLEEIRAISDSERLVNYPFYYAAMGEFELRGGRKAAACEYFRAAHGHARNAMERQFLQNRLDACEKSQ